MANSVLKSQSSTDVTPVTLVSPSRVKTYLECPKKYNYVYVQELQKDEPPKGYFNKGNYFHELAHGYYHLVQSGFQPGSEDIWAAVLEKMKRDLTADTNPDLIPVYGIITRMMSRFVHEQSPKIDEGITVLNVEQQIIYPMENYAMFGYADLVYRDKSGRLHIRDHKTGDKAQTKLDAQFSNQLLYYSSIIYKTTGEIPVAELSYINTKEYVKKLVPTDQAFVFSQVSYSARELDIYFSEICTIIENMLYSTPLPHYGSQCRWCAFQTPCFLSRKGIDATPILNTHYKHVPRDKSGRYARFTESTDNGETVQT